MDIAWFGKLGHEHECGHFGTRRKSVWKKRKNTIWNVAKALLKLSVDNILVVVQIISRGTEVSSFAFVRVVAM